MLAHLDHGSYKRNTTATKDREYDDDYIEFEEDGPIKHRRYKSHIESVGDFDQEFDEMMTPIKSDARKYNGHQEHIPVYTQ